MTINTHKQDLLAILLITVAVIFVYGQTLTHSLIGYDDPYFVGNQPYVLSGLSWENINWAWSTTLMDIWHPFTWFSYHLESELFGATNHSARFLTNTLIHLINALLVYLISKQLKFRKLHALIISLLFAVHPQHVEVVAWISERKELLASCFMLLSLWHYLAHQEESKKRYYFLSLLFFIFALLSKPSAVPLALLLPIISFLSERPDEPDNRCSYKWLKENLLKWLPFFCVAVVISVVAIHLQASPVTEKLNDLDSSVNYLLMIVVRFAWYLRMTFWPAPISFFHPYPVILSEYMIVHSILVTGLFFGVVWWFRTNRIFLIGVCWFILFLAPTSGIIPVEAIYVSDRYSYQAHIGLFIAMLAIVRQIAFGSVSLVLQASFFIAIAVFSVISWKQAALWKDSVSLFEHEILINPESSVALIQLGYAHYANENYDDARGYYLQAVTIDPDGFYGYAYHGYLEETLTNYAQAERLYLLAVSNIDPYGFHHVGDVYEHLIWVSSVLQKHQQAILYLKQGLKYFPDSPYLQETKQYYEKHYSDLSKALL